ncbi:amino acid permease [Virgisporangium aliadipatigenens]|uniref:Amino acid permease n=1 Tax=Virgisporangium aliadipatigenens TaxID=741659 RepID=A0A8J3YUU8_9ACTN|nr:APC family permease [Virgisporangium aliadipatigenens]GIJ50138.1 amino acid permease [Virgisporangium aliadipatigenens]
MSMTAPSGLARRTLGPMSLLFLTVSASAPMVVLAGSMVATYAATGVVGVPLSFLGLGVVLALFAVGYGAMARQVANPGPFYAYLAQGLGRIWGVAGGLLALVSYNAIQISLYGLFGATVAGLVGGMSWWAWAGLAWAVVAAMGVRRIGMNAKVIAVLLITEIVMIVLFDIGAFAQPADPGSLSVPMEPGSLLVSGIGGVLAFGIAAFVGMELAAVYGEEARSGAAVAKATFGAVAVVCILYTVSSWALAVAVGPKSVVDVARNPEAGLPFALIENYYGGAMSTLAKVLLITSMLGAMVSFHNTIARYVFSLARDGVLPQVLGRIGSGGGGGAPISGSLLQSVVALLTFGGFAVVGADPLLDLFTLLSALAAMGVMTLMILASLAVIGFFRRRPQLEEGAWSSALAPGLAALLLLVVLATTVVNVDSLLGPAAGILSLVLPGIVVVSIVVGLVWGSAIKAANPQVFDQVGAGLEQPLAAMDHSLERFRL